MWCSGNSSLQKLLPVGIPGVGGIIRRAVQSWQRLREWQVPLAELDSSARSEDECTFAEAATDYVRRLDRKGDGLTAREWRS